MKHTYRIVALLLAAILLATACGGSDTPLAVGANSVPSSTVVPADPTATPEVEETPSTSTAREQESPSTEAATPTTTEEVEEVTPPSTEEEADEPKPQPQPTPTTEPIRVWEDKPDAVRATLPAIGMDAAFETSHREANGSWNPAGPNLMHIPSDGVPWAPCEIGVVTAMGHAHRFIWEGEWMAGATNVMVVHPRDPADQLSREAGLRGAQLGDVMHVWLSDGSGCTYQVVPMAECGTTSGQAVETHAGQESPAVWWTKDFMETTDPNLHPLTTEWYPQWQECGQGESHLYFMTSGGDAPCENCSRPNLDIIRLKMIDEWGPNGGPK